MEIKTNEYVRNYQGQIEKANKVEYYSDKKEGIIFTEKQIKSISNIKKHHRNILYVLESGDIAEIEHYKRGVTRKFEILRLADEILFFENLHKEFCYDLKKHKWKGPKSNLKIKRIMTKEEFERKSLKLEVI